MTCVIRQGQRHTRPMWWHAAISAVLLAGLLVSMASCGVGNEPPFSIACLEESKAAVLGMAKECAYEPTYELPCMAYPMHLSAEFKGSCAANAHDGEDATSVLFVTDSVFVIYYRPSERMMGLVTACKVVVHCADEQHLEQVKDAMKGEVQLTAAGKGWYHGVRTVSLAD